MLTRYIVRRIGIGFVQLVCLVVAVFFVGLVGLALFAAIRAFQAVLGG